MPLYSVDLYYVFHILLIHLISQPLNSCFSWTIIIAGEGSRSTRELKGFKSGHHWCPKCWEVHTVQPTAWQKGTLLYCNGQFLHFKLYTYASWVTLKSVRSVFPWTPVSLNMIIGVCCFQESAHHTVPCPWRSHRRRHTNCENQLTDHAFRIAAIWQVFVCFSGQSYIMYSICPIYKL